MDVVTLTLNPCLDRTLWVGDFGVEPARIQWQTGGKGVNLARVLGNLGARVKAVCPVGGETGERFCALAREEGIRLDAVAVRAPMRVIDTYARERDFAQQVDYRAGGELDGAELDALEAAVFAALDEGAQVLAVCGSASCNAAAARIPGILQRAKAMGVATVLDGNGASLAEGVKGAPDLIKPNQRELEALTGSPEPGAAWRLIERGVGQVLVSMGAAGCCLVGGRGDLANLAPLAGLRGEVYMPAPRVKAVNPVGSGDSFLAGYLYGQLRSLGEDASLKLANACGAANAAMFPAARVGWAQVQPLLPHNWMEECHFGML